MDKNNTFCTAPWTSISQNIDGTIRPCCKYEQSDLQTDYKLTDMRSQRLTESWNGPEMQRLRQAFIDGKKPIECRQCWNEEKAGLFSYRRVLNSYLYDLYPEQVERYDFTSTVSESPFYLDLKLSNVCNLKCRMCSPMTSSLIQKEEEKHNPEFRPDDYWHKNKFLETDDEEIFLKWLPHIDRITFTGGEPFMGKENKDMLRLMIELGYASKIDLHFNTNGMFMGDDIVNMLKQYRGVSVAFSVDDIGDRLYYHRSGANWELIRKNIIKAKEKLPGVKIEIYCTVNNYNVWYVDEAMEEFRKLTPFVSYGFVYEPAYLSPRKLHPLIKDEIEEKYKDRKEYQNIIKYIRSDDEDLTAKFHDQIRHLDKIRNESFAEVFPEWAALVMYNE